MRIYLTDLAAYNGGHLVGEWLDLPMEEEDLKSKLQEILACGSDICGNSEVHEEYFITDWECELFKIGEYESIYKLNDKASKVEDLDEDEKKNINFLLDNNLASDLDEAIERLDDVIVHKESDMKSVAQEYIEENILLDKLPDIIRNNIDYKGVATDLGHDGNYFEIDGDVFEYRGA